MKRSVQEIVELVVFGAIALLIGTGVLWLVGWVFTGAGWLALAITGLLWRVLIVLVPLVIAAGLIYWLVNYLMKQRRDQTAAAAAGGTVTAASATQQPPAAEPGGAPVADPSPPAFTPADTSAAEAATERGAESVTEVRVADETPAADPNPWAAGAEPITVPAEPVPAEFTPDPVIPEQPAEPDPAQQEPTPAVPADPAPFSPPAPAEPAAPMHEQGADSQSQADDDADRPLRNG